MEDTTFKNEGKKEKNMEFLKAILGEELYAQFVEKINAYNGDEANKDKKINLANLTEGKYINKDKYTELENNHNSKLEELKQANTLIADLQKSVKGNEEMQAKFNDYQNQVQALQEQNLLQRINFAVSVGLLEAKAKDVEYLTYKLNQKGKLELDEQGKVKGWDEKIKELKTQFPEHFDDGKKSYDIKKLPDDGNEPENQPQTLADAIKANYENKQ